MEVWCGERGCGAPPVLSPGARSVEQVGRLPRLYPPTVMRFGSMRGKFEPSEACSVSMAACTSFTMCPSSEDRPPKRA